jgi:hypothetical protein
MTVEVAAAHVLSDPFVMFPLQSVARDLGSLLAESEDGLADAPPARKYWDVKHEHAHEVSGFLLGTAFVLGQVALCAPQHGREPLRRQAHCDHHSKVAQAAHCQIV